MNNRLTQAQLSQIVAEVERLSQRRDDELEPEQVKQILQELSLPPELFDEALVQLRRREALAVQQRRNR
jgi:transcriptional regulator of met regulon